MKNTLNIFKRDLKKIFTNSCAIVLAVGIAVLPSLYAWFNIYANWDPYGATGNMQVAVIIEDEGYRYRNIDINVGAKMEENLKANDAIDWQFLSKKDAISGIESGKYYAGIEIPKGFSKSLTSIVSSKFEQPKIKYYANEKKNAIATKITDKVVQTVQTEVNESFVTTVINVVSTMLGVVANAANNGAGEMLGDLKGKLENADTSIANIQKTVDSFESVMTLAQTLNEAVNDEKVTDMLQKSGTLIESGEDMAKLLETTVSGLSASAATALGKAADGINDAAKTVGEIGSAGSAKAAQKAGEALKKVSIYRASLEAVKNLLDTLKTSLSIQLPALEKLSARIDAALTRTDKVIALLSDIQSGAIGTRVKQITAEMNTLTGEIATFESTYRKDVQPTIEKNLSAVMDMLVVTGDLIADLNGEMPTIQALSKSLNASVKSGADLVAAINKLLGNTRKQLKTLLAKLDSLKDSELLNTVQNVAGKNTDQLGAFLACPVQVETEKVYGIENYGSAMAPFYSTLAIWVGAMVLIAVVKTEVKKKHEIGSVKAHQAYFGRMFTFLVFSVTQALIICLGDLYFLKIQCYHPAKFILVGVLAAVAFTVFVFSLGYTFGDIGKAVGIIFLVVQIGGSGGTFPIDVTPQFFRTINPFLPFTYVVEAMRECVCGTYANDYWVDLLKLCAYILIGLIIGIGVKFIVKKPICFFEKQIKKTDLF